MDCIIGVKGMNRKVCSRVYQQHLTFIFKSESIVFFLRYDGSLSIKKRSSEMNICDRIPTLPVFT